MRSSQTITLFSHRQEVPQRSSSFVVSALTHGAVIAMLLYGILSPPRIQVRNPPERFTLRHLDLNLPDPIKPRAPGAINYPGPKSPADGGKPAEQLAALRQSVQAKPGPQTLVQPKLPDPPKPTIETPTPTVVLWTPEKVPVKAIVLPKLDKPVMANVRPSIELPNAEVNLADIRMDSSDLSRKNLPILPSTTSPVVVHGPDLPQKVPSSTTNSTAPPTPATVLSLSDLQMKQGTVFLPAANQSASANSPGALAQGQAKDTSQAGHGNPASNGGGSGQSAGGSNGQPSSGQGTGNQLTADRIKLPIDGQFGSVVTGASLDSKYPEASPIWRGRMTYTVYLHLGLAKAWILQFSLPRTVDAAAAGDVSHIEAPWPYNIIRPNLAPGEINADACMVHGYVDKAGRFEALAIVFPPDFTQAQFVLDSLRQWEFRPATQHGQPIKVEVLLIIPDIE